MVDLIPVMDGEVKFRDGKKWKLRYAVVTRLSPVADSLTFQLWKNRKDREMNSSPTKGSLVLEDFIGIETGFTLDRESLTLAIVLRNMVISLAFNCREVLMRWKIRISSQFETGRSFNGSLVQSSSKLLPLSSGPIRIHVQNDRFYITSGIPPSLIHSWKFTHLRRYGSLKEHQFVFEGGSLCEKGEGVHILRLPPTSSTDLKAAFDLGAKGKLPGKASSNTASNGDSAESRGNSISSSSNGSYYRGGLSQFSSSCDTMSDVLSEVTTTTSASGGPPEAISEHLVNRRSLLERIYSFCEKSDKKKPLSSSSFDPTWNMKKEFKECKSNSNHRHHNNNNNNNNNHDSLISFDEEVRYDNPRGTSFDKILPKKVGGDNTSASNIPNVFDNYDIPKTIPTSSLYDVPRSLKSNSQRGRSPNELDWNENNKNSNDKNNKFAIYQNATPSSKIERVRLNGSGRMPVMDMRKSGGCIIIPSPEVVLHHSTSLASSSSSSSSPPYMNIDGSPSIVQPTHHLYENILPPLGACLQDAAASHNYDTINIKLRKFHDLLSVPKTEEGVGVGKESYACNLEFSKRKSLSLSSILGDEFSELHLKELSSAIAERRKRRLSLT